MSTFLNNVGLAAAPVVNQLATNAVFKEHVCLPVCINADQLSAVVSYTYGQPVLKGSTVFVPVTANIQVNLPPGCNCNKPLTFVEHFTATFQGQTGVPTNVIFDRLGTYFVLSCYKNCRATVLSINDSITITITPPAAAA